ncbi:ABC transporter ATP-binding protein [Butyrivibrio sp.]|uniref:ABC transporter ATP-binding protein n=1 Tax=Butyrivibrio sp. TaxID=28121 RepID=UPI0025FCC05A|nr:ABC transporter ATP-binding protein [Butyrivibrio sp.]
MAMRFSAKTDKPKDTKGALKRLLKYCFEYKYRLIVTICLCLCGNLLSLAGPKLAGNAIEEIACGRGNINMQVVEHFVLLMIICYIASALISYIVSVTMMKTGRLIAHRMRQDVFDKLMTLPVGYFDRNQAGDIISRVSYDIDVISTSISTDTVQILTSIVTVVGSFCMMFLISPQLVVITLVTIPLAVMYTRFMGKRTRPLFSKRSAKYGQMNGFVEEMFSGQKTILAYGRENKVTENFDVINNEAAELFYRSEYYGMTIGPSVGFINNLGLALTCMFGSVLYLYKIVNLGEISSFVLYTRKFSGPINEIANIINDLYSALAASERVFRLLDEDEEVEDIEEAVELVNVRGDVEFDHIKFGYVEGRTIINDFSLKVPAGKRIAIVGKTGAGKTTLINLLMRFYDVSSGHIYVDGNEIRSLTRKSLRRAYAMVLQDTWLFEGTVYENIAYGCDNVSRDDVINAAKSAHIHSFITHLPMGYDTVISEDGGNISKGQKQLLTIARAFLYDASILILDEATSNVDTTTEQEIQKAMTSLMKGRTCFIIAHRLSTIQNADNILVLDHGDIVEQGTHEELMNKEGTYYDMYMSQWQ